MPDWLLERGVGENRAALVEDGAILEARIELDGTILNGSILKVRLENSGIKGRNAIAVGEDGSKFLLPRGAPGFTEGASITIEVARSAIPGCEPWKLPTARLTDRSPGLAQPFADIQGRLLLSPAPRDELNEAGWNDLMEQARSGVIRFAGGELRISVTPAMTLIDVDGYLDPQELALVGAGEAARAVRRLDIGGSIGIDLPTAGSKTARFAAATALDKALAKPFERTAVNGFGFVQIVRPRVRASLLELAGDRALFEARALLRSASFESAGPKTLVANPHVIRTLELNPAWLAALSRQLGGLIRLRADESLSMSGAYAERA